MAKLKKVGPHLAQRPVDIGQLLQILLKIYVARNVDARDARRCRLRAHAATLDIKPTAGDDTSFLSPMMAMEFEQMMLGIGIREEYRETSESETMQALTKIAPLPAKGQTAPLPVGLTHDTLHRAMVALTAEMVLSAGPFSRVDPLSVPHVAQQLAALRGCMSCFNEHTTQLSALKMCSAASQAVLQQALREARAVSHPTRYEVDEFVKQGRADRMHARAMLDLASSADHVASVAGTQQAQTQFSAAMSGTVYESSLNLTKGTVLTSSGSSSSSGKAVGGSLPSLVAATSLHAQSASATPTQTSLPPAMPGHGRSYSNSAANTAGSARSAGTATLGGAGAKGASGPGPVNTMWSRGSTAVSAGAASMGSLPQMSGQSQAMFSMPRPVHLTDPDSGIFDGVGSRWGTMGTPGPSPGYTQPQLHPEFQQPQLSVQLSPPQSNLGSLSPTQRQRLQLMARANSYRELSASPEQHSSGTGTAGHHVPDGSASKRHGYSVSHATGPRSVVKATGKLKPVVRTVQLTAAEEAEAERQARIKARSQASKAQTASSGNGGSSDGRGSNAEGISQGKIVAFRTRRRHVGEEDMRSDEERQLDELLRKEEQLLGQYSAAAATLHPILGSSRPSIQAEAPLGRRTVLKSGKKQPQPWGVSSAGREAAAHSTASKAAKGASTSSSPPLLVHASPPGRPSPSQDSVAFAKRAYGAPVGSIPPDAAHHHHHQVSPSRSPAQAQATNPQRTSDDGRQDARRAKFDVAATLDYTSASTAYTSYTSAHGSAPGLGLGTPNTRHDQHAQGGGHSYGAYTRTVSSKHGSSRQSAGVSLPTLIEHEENGDRPWMRPLSGVTLSSPLASRGRMTPAGTAKGKGMHMNRGRNGAVPVVSWTTGALVNSLTSPVTPGPGPGPGDKWVSSHAHAHAPQSLASPGFTVGSTSTFVSHSDDGLSGLPSYGSPGTISSPPSSLPGPAYGAAHPSFPQMNHQDITLWAQQLMQQKVGTNVGPAKTPSPGVQPHMGSSRTQYLQAQEVEEEEEDGRHEFVPDRNAIKAMSSLTGSHGSNAGAVASALRGGGVPQVQSYAPAKGGISMAGKHGSQPFVQKPKQAPTMAVLGASSSPTASKGTAVRGGPPAGIVARQANHGANGPVHGSGSGSAKTVAFTRRAQQHHHHISEYELSPQEYYDDAQLEGEEEDESEALLRLQLLQAGQAEGQGRSNRLDERLHSLYRAQGLAADGLPDPY